MEDATRRTFLLRCRRGGVEHREVVAAGSGRFATTKGRREDSDKGLRFGVLAEVRGLPVAQVLPTGPPPPGPGGAPGWKNLNVRSRGNDDMTLPPDCKVAHRLGLGRQPSRPLRRSAGRKVTSPGYKRYRPGEHRVSEPSHSRHTHPFAAGQLTHVPWNHVSNRPLRKVPTRQRAEPLDRPTRESRTDLSRLLRRREILLMATSVHRAFAVSEPVARVWGWQTILNLAEEYFGP
jgi:hypothetical protein